MEFPASHSAGTGKITAEATGRFAKAAQRKYLELGALRQRLSNTHAQYAEGDFEDLLWMLRKAMELYREMVQQTSKLAIAIDTEGATCTRETMDAILREEAARAQAHLLVNHSICEARKITADYKDAVVAICDWADVD